MAFLLAGLAIGATAMALSESDRDYYYNTRVSMDYLGNKNGVDIYKDRVTGFYYADDGWEVRRVGKTGWRPHPIDMERLKTKLSQYSPAQVQFSGYILATYIGKEQDLWNTIFKKFEMPKEPKKPHFSRGLRKQRWAEYDEQYEAWEKDLDIAKKKFRDECASWDLQKQEYNGIHAQAESGQNLLRQAFVGGPAPNVEVFRITVPAGKKPGDTISVQAGNRQVEILIPAGSVAGTEIQFEVPRASEDAPLATPAGAQVPTALMAQNQAFSEQGAPTAAAYSSPPPALNPFDAPSQQAPSTRPSSRPPAPTSNNGAGQPKPEPANSLPPPPEAIKPATSFRM